MRYTGYGERSETTGASVHPTDLQWAGGWGYQQEHADATDPGIGLVYVQNRYYEPATGSGSGNDPIGYAGGLNLYEYCDGEPVGMVDPEGEIPLPVVGGVVGAIGGGAWGAYQAKRAGQNVWHGAARGAVFWGVTGATGGALLTAGGSSALVGAAWRLSPALGAAAQQIRSGYRPDRWGTTTLQAGTRIAMGTDGKSGFFTSAETIGACNKSAATIWRGLQVPSHPLKGYRMEMTVYEITRDARVAQSLAEANTRYGPGGLHQFYIQNFQKWVESGLLDPVDAVRLLP